MHRVFGVFKGLGPFKNFGLQGFRLLAVGDLAQGLGLQGLAGRVPGVSQLPDSRHLEDETASKVRLQVFSFCQMGVLFLASI